jgi:hypothetical protein
VRSEHLRSVDQLTPGASDGGPPLSARPDDDVAFYAEHGWWISPKVLSEDFTDADLDAIEQQFAADGRPVTRVPLRLRNGQSASTMAGRRTPATRPVRIFERAALPGPAEPQARFHRSGRVPHDLARPLN